MIRSLFSKIVALCESLAKRRHGFWFICVLPTKSKSSIGFDLVSSILVLRFFLTLNRLPDRTLVPLSQQCKSNQWQFFIIVDHSRGADNLPSLLGLHIVFLFWQIKISSRQRICQSIVLGRFWKESIDENLRYWCSLHALEQGSA